VDSDPSTRWHELRVRFTRCVPVAVGRRRGRETCS
jgi:hypothetical protein